MKKRIICLDYGDKNIGVAVSDPLGYSAQGLCVLRRTDANEFKKIITSIKELLEKYGTDTVVLGYPKSLNNYEGKRCMLTVQFKERLEKAISGINVIMFDERLSSAGAMRSLDEANISGTKKKEVIDKMAAVFILQGYLETIRNKEKNEMTDDYINDMDEFDDDDELEIVTLTSDDGDTLECIVIDSCEYEGTTYLLVVNAEDSDDDDAPADILKEVQEDEETFSYEFISDDEEFEKIAKMFEDADGDYELQGE